MPDRIKIFIIVIMALCISCSQESNYPADVLSALKQAGENQVELEKVLAHYAETNDSLMYDAACFLIANMEGHCYATYALTDTSGSEYELDVMDYPDFENLLQVLDSMEQLHGSLNFGKKDLIYDLDSIKADFLISQIDYAFKVWLEKPWAKSISYEVFKNYVLPYRGSNEPLENWRESFIEKYKYIDQEMDNLADPIEAANIINNDIRSWFKFDRRYYLHPTDLGLSEMLDCKMGRCEDMTNITIYAMRANGLAVTSDYTPYWANTGSNHAWNSIVMPDGEVIPFMGAESNPREYELANKFAKVYRKSFGKNKDNLIFQVRKQEKVPGWLGGKSYIDVTADYTATVNLTIPFEKDVPDSIDIAYICVFNSGEWKAIDWARIENGSAFFTDLGPGVVYLPALYINEEIVPYGIPFIPHGDYARQEFRQKGDLTTSFRIKSTTKDMPIVSTTGMVEIHLTDGQTYELFYWNDGWQSVGKKTAEDKSLGFENIPARCLYWLVAEDSDKEERIFSIENSKQIWW
jgi:Transglutaminase-like superfamily